ncbi:uncharacterized protein HGUI_03931 [Hanseniaspora guilliermondii]|uniref:DNA repair metallo-beta-lactamase domain-containing protein n=1 Tax=Hanseniaspora guilliermondii TaxID=56406 RepID=A0A1L0B5Q6_9ASCO|nr:uncharacterized protein HGUI_03931 [Hanseniaspora guilliermondii]
MNKYNLKIKQTNITDFYKTKNQVISKSKKEEYISLITDDEPSECENDLIILEEKIKPIDDHDEESHLKKSTKSQFFKANENEVVNKYDENLFDEKRAILLQNLKEKPEIYRPILNEDILINDSSQRIPSYRIHQFPECEDKITIDFFPKNSQTVYHFISHLHSDHHVGFSKKWLAQNPNAIIVFGEENYLPFLYKFNIVNFKSKVKDLEEDYEAITSRILVIRKNKPLKLFLNKGDSYILVKTLNANHCIGACLLLFEYYDEFNQLKETVLHTGDFRYNSKMMLPKLKNIYFDKIYLDTTYKSPVWNFTPKEELLDKVSDFLQLKLKPAIIDNWFQKGRIQRTLDTFVKNITFDKKSLKTLIVLGSYTIGKEFLASGISSKLNDCPILLDRDGFRSLYNLPKNGNFIISNDVVNDLINSFKDHDIVVYLGSIGNPKEIKQKLKLFNVEKLFGKMITICISLSGWNFYNWKNFFQDMEIVEELPIVNESNCFRVLEEFNDNSYVKRKYQLDEIFNSDLIFDDNFEVDLENLPKWIITQDKLNRIVYWKLSYSDHSSYKELSQCCTELKYGEIIPTVNTHNMELLDYHINLWKLCNISNR